MDGTVNDDDARLILTGDTGHLGHVQVLTAVLLSYPAAIEPQDIYLTVTRQNFVHLIVGELLELLPAPGVLINGIVHVATFLGIHIPPVVLRVPVGLREVGSDGELLLAEGIQHMLQHIATWIVLKGVLGNGKIGLL